MSSERICPSTAEPWGGKDKSDSHDGTTYPSTASQACPADTSMTFPLLAYKMHSAACIIHVSHFVAHFPQMLYPWQVIVSMIAVFIFLTILLKQKKKHHKRETTERIITTTWDNLVRNLRANGVMMGEKFNWQQGKSKWKHELSRGGRRFCAVCLFGRFYEDVLAGAVCWWQCWPCEFYWKPWLQWSITCSI